MLGMHRTTVALAFAAALLGPLASAEAKGLAAHLAPERVVLDGLPDEWDGRWRDLDQTPERGGGKATSESDASGQILLSHDADALYLAAVITDDRLVAGGDHVELVLGIPGGQTASIELYPGAKGRRAVVKLGGRPLAAAKIVEAPSDGGYSLEAKVPWSALPQSRTVRIGYRGAVFFHDADASSRPETVIGTSERRDYAHLPPLSLAPELALGSGLLRERNIQAAPSQNLLANVVGDALEERVLVYGPYLVVLGPGYREGRQYYYRDLEGTLLGFEVKDVTGDGRDDLDRALDYGAAFIQRHGDRFTGAAADDDAVDVAMELVVDHTLKPVVIDAVVGVERGNDGSNGTLDHGESSRAESTTGRGCGEGSAIKLSRQPLHWPPWLTWWNHAARHKSASIPGTGSKSAGGSALTARPAAANGAASRMGSKCWWGATIAGAMHPASGSVASAKSCRARHPGPCSSGGNT